MPILDLGCLEGLFSIECAQQGAKVLGIDARHRHIRKANFAKSCLDLPRLRFVVDDVRNLELERHGRFDAIICSGLLYHLPAADAVDLVRMMHKMARRMVIVDTHVSLNPKKRVRLRRRAIMGESYREHDEGDSEERMEQRDLRSYGNRMSFLFSRPSLMNLFMATGFSKLFRGAESATPQFRRRGTRVSRPVYVRGDQGHHDRVRYLSFRERTQRTLARGRLDYGSKSPA